MGSEMCIRDRFESPGWKEQSSRNPCENLRQLLDLVIIGHIESMYPSYRVQHCRVLTSDLHQHQLWKVIDRAAFTRSKITRSGDQCGRIQYDENNATLASKRGVHATGGTAVERRSSREFSRCLGPPLGPYLELCRRHAQTHRHILVTVSQTLRAMSSTTVLFGNQAQPAGRNAARRISMIFHWT